MEITNNNRTYTLNPATYVTEAEVPAILGKLNADDFCGFAPLTIYISHIEITPTSATAVDKVVSIHGPIPKDAKGADRKPKLTFKTVKIAEPSHFQITRIHYQRPVAPTFAARCVADGKTIALTPIFNPVSVMGG